MIQAAVLGFGTVGSGVVEVLDRNRDAVKGRVPEGIDVKYILDLREFPESPYKDKVVHDVNVILDDPEVKIVIETMGGTGAAYAFTKSALERGKSVCTSNKANVAAHGPELLRIAKEHHCSYLYEASVGGGIPIIRPLNTSLAQEHITEIFGILNGTTNYILTKMEREGTSFEAALKEAQRLGYAEANPEADVEGHDACRKIAILSSIITGKTIDWEDLYCEGITKVTPEDFAYARALGYKVKLLGVSRAPEGGGFDIHVAPYLVPESSMLATVSDVYNGILVHGDMVDDLLFYGQGAGKLATASAVVSDVIACGESLGKTLPDRWTAAEVGKPAPFGTMKRRFYVRIDAAETAKAKELFGNGITEVEKTADAATAAGDPAGSASFAFVTEALSEDDFAKKAAELATLQNRIRILDRK